MTSAIALFGNGSWLSTAANYVSKEPYNSTDHEKLPWQLMCRGMPFSKLWSPGVNSFPEMVRTDLVSLCGWHDRGLFDGYQSDENDLLQLTHQFLGVFAPVGVYSNDSEERSLRNTKSLLNVAMFVANRALLTLLSPEVGPGTYDLTGRKIYNSPGVTVQKPVFSKATLIVLSVLIGLQLLGLGYLTYYLYRFPTWSSQLDAMAMARIGASLDHRGVLPAIGPVSKKDLDSLQTVEGLIGIVEKVPYRESSQTRPVSSDLNTADASDVELQQLNSVEEGDTSAADGSEVELQQLNSTEEGCTSAEVHSSGVELGLGASGAILSTIVPRRSPYVLGMKKAWRATFISRVPSSVDDVAEQKVNLLLP
jgi:hypothetical protein